MKLEDWPRSVMLAVAFKLLMSQMLGSGRGMQAQRTGAISVQKERASVRNG